MPSPRDITGDLSRLPRHRLKVEKAPPPPPKLAGALRPMRFDLVVWGTGLLLLAAVAAQIALLLWML